MKKIRWDLIKKYGFEFLAIFIGVFAAFALENWNDKRKDRNTEDKILMEINNGLAQDLKDIEENVQGHKNGLQGAKYVAQVLLNKRTEADSFGFHYINLFRDFISLQNISGYETLKSKGLEIVQNDSLRTQILSLYENDYNALRKLEEDYSELQFFENYSRNFDKVFAPNFILDSSGMMSKFNYPVQISENDKKGLVIDLWRIQNNRGFILLYYEKVKTNILKLQNNIEAELER